MDQPPRAEGFRQVMLEPPGGDGSLPERLDATGPRDVVFCHQCEHEWYQDDHGLICPRCEGAFTEVVTPESDPRPQRPQILPNPATHPGRWEGPGDDSDPEEADIEEHITHGPGGSVLFHRTVRTSGPRTIPRPEHHHHHHDEQNTDIIMRDFEAMIGNLMGPRFQPGRPGRSGPSNLFPQGPSFAGQTFRITNDRPIVEQRFTFGSGPRAADNPGHQTAADGGPPLVPDLATIIGSLFGAPTGGQPGQRDGPPIPGLPAGLSGLFAAMANPANARSGDAVYSQEALDRIISQLMEQNASSNAPGPASPDAISALPKKKLDEKELGPEGKAECSVCMDEVTTGVEVVMLPCSHWFHEACASAWLSEHNTCPICRKGIDSDNTRPANSRRSSQGSQSTRNEHRARRMSSLRPRMERFASSSAGGWAARSEDAARNEARLESIRNSAGMPPPSQSEERYQTGGMHEHSRWRNASGSATGSDDYNPPMPGSFHRQNSDISENQRDSRRTNTSGSDRSRESRRSSQSGAGNTGGGAMGWLRDRFGSGSGQGSGGANRRS